MTTQVELNDITRLNVDCIVNAANKYLVRGGGVCGAIHAAAGLELAQECKAIGGCIEGSAVITKGYKLPQKWVIHAVGPEFNRSETPEILLAACYERCITIAESHDIRSIAFPCISTGVFGYPSLEAAKIAVRVIKDFKKYSSVQQVIFCCYSQSDFEIYKMFLTS